MFDWVLNMQRLNWVFNTHLLTNTLGTQSVFTFSKLTIETLEQGLK